MKQLWIEPFGGMAGDMFLAALLDLGDPRFGLSHLEALAEELVPGECRLSLRRTQRASIAANTLEVRTPETDHAPHRHLSDLLRMLAQSSLSATAGERAARVLGRIAEAEARVHGCTPEAVHFHEVGAVDTLIDVAGACLAMQLLGIEAVCASVPYAGGGSVHCAHGEMPVPAPGTLGILRGIPFHVGAGGERLTPTGAALLAELVDCFEPTGTLQPHATGYGAGQRDPAEGPPNLLRVSLVQWNSSQPVGDPRGEAYLLECNLDDATGEELGFLLQELRGAGALEVWSAPVQMKKDRPGSIVSALCRAELRTTLEQVCIRNSPTLGLRWTRVERRECPREEREIELEGERIRFKLRRRAGAAMEEQDLFAEYDDVARLARKRGAGWRATERELLALAWRTFSRDA